MSGLPGLQAIDPRTGEVLGQPHDVTAADTIDAIASLAAAAFATEAAERSFSDARLLETIATRLSAAAPTLLDSAHRETAIPEPRLAAELDRTTGQLRAFADLARSGRALEPIIDTADPEAVPPRPDQRRMNVPLGPVAVFAASNFPFAFGIAGGDTASALAAGCPVIAKAHPAHPHTSVLIAAAVDDAARDAGAPPSWFALVQGRGPETGRALATADPIEVIAFTGSRAAGTALLRAGAQRERPIPVYAEMGSINPQLITPNAARTRGEHIADALSESIVLGHGQLCTKPGLVLLVDDAAGRALIARLAWLLRSLPAAPMLYPALRDALAGAIDAARADPRVTALVDPAPDSRPGAWQAPALLETRAGELHPDDELLHELFGPAALVAWCADSEQLATVARDVLPGTLAASVHAEADDPVTASLLAALRRHAGRIVFNGYPTGVIVGHATVHGGPFPATTNASHTSVGLTAIRRFQRPLAYQSFADELLPPALQDANPLALHRLVNGEWESSGTRALAGRDRA